MNLWSLAAGFTGSLIIAGAAYAKRALSLSGAAAAIVLGTWMYALGSPVWFGTLIAFFVSSTLLSKWKKHRRQEAESSYEKSGRRDAGQVAANGLAGLVLCIINAIWPHPGWLAAFIGVMASVNADTWATEVGGLSRTEPRSILTGRKVPAGTSGGVTLLGLAASAAGSLFIGGIAWAFLRLWPASLDAAWIQAGGWGLSIGGFDSGESPSFLLLAAACLASALVGGMAGSLADSWLGAKWQRMQVCRVCGKEVESHVHCGTPTEYGKGIRWLNNDAVNILSSLLGAFLAVVVWRLM